MWCSFVSDCWITQTPDINFGSLQRVKMLLICVIEGPMLPSAWWCHRMRRRQARDPSPPACPETPPLLLISHLGVAFATIDLSTWNLANDQENDLKLRRAGKHFWSRLLNTLCLLNKHTSQVIERPGLLSWKARFAYGSPSCQTTAMAPAGKSMPFQAPSGWVPLKAFSFLLFSCIY